MQLLQLVVNARRKPQGIHGHLNPYPTGSRTWLLYTEIVLHSAHLWASLNGHNRQDCLIFKPTPHISYWIFASCIIVRIAYQFYILWNALVLQMTGNLVRVLPSSRKGSYTNYPIIMCILCIVESLPFLHYSGLWPYANVTERYFEQRTISLYY
jgi:hypothetical protein